MNNFNEKILYKVDFYKKRVSNMAKNGKLMKRKHGLRHGGLKTCQKT